MSTFAHGVAGAVAGMVTVWPHAKINGWRGDTDSDGMPVTPADPVTGKRRQLLLCPTMTLADALDAEHADDAHCWPGVVVYEGTVVSDLPRLNIDSLPTLAARRMVVYFGAIFVDVDDKTDGRHKKGLPALPEWRADMGEKLAALPEDIRSGMARYDTNGGFRLVWTVDNAPSISEFVPLVRCLVRELRKYGIDPDEFSDFGRCYRLPRVVRRLPTGERQAQRLAGDWQTALGPLRWRPTPEALEAIAKAKVREPAPTQPPLDDKPEVNASGFDPLALLEAAGVEIVSSRPFGDGGELHTPRHCLCDRQEGGTACVVIVAESGAPGIKCLRATCDYSQSKMTAGEAWKLWRSQHDASYHTDAETAEILEWAASADFASPSPAPALAPTEQQATVAPETRKRKAPSFMLGSEKEIADRVCADLEGAGEKIVFDRGRLWKYAEDAGVWCDLDMSLIHKLVASYDGAWIFQGKDKETGEAKLAPLKVSNRLTVEVAKLVSTLRKKLGFFDNAADGLCFANGFVRVDSKGVHLEPHAPEQRATGALAFDYLGTGAQPSLFLKALDEIFVLNGDTAGLVQLLREFVGVCFVGRATSFKKGLLLVGEGANGKSTIADVVSALFDGPLISNVPPQDTADPYSRAMLVTSRLNVVSELPETDILESGAMKAIFAGDMIKAREIREAPFNFRPKCGELFSANNLPAVRDMSKGFWRRWLVIRFQRIFEDDEQDLHLAERIIGAELAQIAAWVLDGATMALARGKYAVPAESDEALAEWRGEADQVMQFIDQRCLTCDREAKEALPAERLYRIYLEWTQATRHRAMTMTKLGTRLKALKVAHHKRNNGMFYALKTKAPALAMAV